MKIINIKNVGCIENIDKEVDFGEKGFIYGLNGSGKSTLKEIIIASFDEKKKLTKTFNKTISQCSAEIELLGKRYKFNKGVVENKDDTCLLHVFDEAYVENNVYVNGTISDNNKKNYYRVLVGEGVNKKVETMLELSTEIQNMMKELTLEKKAIDSLIFDFDDFLSIMKGINDILEKEYTIKNLVEEVLEKRILKNIKEINYKSISWLKNGENFQKDENICPYCGQDLDETQKTELINHYASLVIDVENIQKNTIKELNDFYKRLAKISMTNIEYIESPVDIEEIQQEIEKLIETKKADLSQKYSIDKSIFEKLTLDKNHLTEISQLLNDFEIYNLPNIFEVDDPSSKTRFDLDVLDELKDTAFQSKLTGSIRKIISNYGKVFRKFDSIKKDQQQIMENNLKEINLKLSFYDFPYTVDCESVKQKSLKSASTPQPQLILKAKEYGDTKIKFDKDNIKTVLSEGEKSIFAWVIFLIELNNSLKKGKHIIVIDDPISSYDSYRRFQLIHDIKTISSLQTEKEILILSHEKSFVNCFAKLPKYQFFDISDRTINRIEPRDIIENDIRDNLKFIKNHEVLSVDSDLIEYLIQARNIIENYHIEQKYLDIVTPIKASENLCYEKSFENISEFLHFKTDKLNKDTFKYINDTFNKITGSELLIDYDNVVEVSIDIMNLLPSLINNAYLSRIVVNKYLIDICDKEGEIIGKCDTTGELLSKTKRYIEEDRYNKIASYLPILNAYNHPNHNYGLRKIDCSQLKLESMYEFVNELLKEVKGGIV